MSGLRQWLDASDEYRRSWERTVKPSIRSRRRRAEQILAKSVGTGNGDVLHPVSTQSGGRTGRGRTAESDPKRTLKGSAIVSYFCRIVSGPAAWTAIPIPILRSRRLTLRRLRVDDHPRLFAMANDVEVTRYLNEGSPPSAEEVWQRMAAAIGQWGLRGYGMMAVEDQDGFVGRLGFYHPYDQPDPLLVYVLCRDGWGKGYATEAVTLIRDWIFVVHKLRRFLSHIMPDNVASARVASKLGAIRNGTTVQRGTVLDVWRYDAPD